MNPVKSKLASLMIDAARKGICSLDKTSPHFKDLKTIDIDKVITEDVNRICEGISMAEIMQVMPLVAKLKIVCKADEQDAVKCRIKEIALRVVERVECAGGKLKIPASCRDLLLEL